MEIQDYQKQVCICMLYPTQDGPDDAPCSGMLNTHMDGQHPRQKKTAGGDSQGMIQPEGRGTRMSVREIM